MRTRTIFWTGILLVALAWGAAAQDPEPAAELALTGSDPVLLVQGEEVAGEESLAVDRGRFRYLFAKEATRKAFLAEPERYEIQMDGRCAAMPSATGDPELFAVHEGKIYIFGTPSCREDFLASPATYTTPGLRRNVAVLVYDGVELLDFAGPGEVFSAAGRHHGPGVEVFTVGPSARPVVSQGFVTVTPRYAMAESPPPDVLIVPGGGVRSLLGDPAAMTWIRRVAAEAEVVMSVCNGAIVLAEAGLLDGLEATTHHGSLAALRKAAPKATVHADRRFVDNGRIVTAAGVSAGIDAALHVVSRLFGPEQAEGVARYMEYPWQPSGETEKRLAASQ